jgi:hypothetical protein
MPESPSASPWPPFVAVGLAVAEAGVLFGSFAVAVAGVCCFGAAVAGLATESAHLRTWSRASLVVALPLAALGALVFLTTSYQTRGEAVLVGTGLLVAFGLVDSVRRQLRPVG